MNRCILTIFFLLSAVSFCESHAIKDGGPPHPNALSEAAELLPAWLGDGFCTSVTDHFFVAHEAGPAEAKELADQLESAFEHFHLFFEQFDYTLSLPEGKLSWIGFSDPKRFSHYSLRADKMDLSRLSGYYSARTNRVAIVASQGTCDDTPETIRTVRAVDADGEIAALAADNNPNQSVKVAHELAHQLAFNTGLQKRGVMYPLWVSEGLATQYETMLSYCRDTNIARSDRLRQMQTRDRLIPLDEFITVTRLPADRQACEELYAQAWGFFDFLLKHRPAQLRNYLQTLYAMEPGYRTPSALRKEFAEHFGPAEALGKEWIQYLCGQ